MNISIFKCDRCEKEYRSDQKAPYLEDQPCCLSIGINYGNSYPADRPGTIKVWCRPCVNLLGVDADKFNAAETVEEQKDMIAQVTFEDKFRELLSELGYVHRDDLPNY